MYPFCVTVGFGGTKSAVASRKGRSPPAAVFENFYTKRKGGDTNEGSIRNGGEKEKWSAQKKRTKQKRERYKRGQNKKGSIRKRTQDSARGTRKK